MNTFTFKTREEYFEYKAEWKEEYFAISKEIRKSALERRDAERAMSKAYSSATWSATHKARNNHQALKAKATALLQERWESRAEAGRQMQASKIAA